MTAMASIETRVNSRGTTYRVIWRQADMTPPRQFETFPTLKAAQAFKKLVEGSENRWPHGWVKGHGFKEKVKPASTASTFDSFYERAIKSRARANERTRGDYRRDIRLHVSPTFGSVPMDEITREDVDLWLIALKANGCLPKTVKNIHGVASSVFEDAIRAGLVPGPNPFRGAMAKLPPVRVEQMTFLTKQEVGAIAQQIGEQYSALVVFLGHTGLRWGEATALRVGDVSILGNRRTVTVTKAWKRDESGQHYIGDPKTPRARRTIVLGKEATDVLIPLVASRSSDEYLFTTKTGRPVMHATFYKDHWVKAVAALNALEVGALGKRPRIQDLRHSQASWLIAAGVPLHGIQRRMGHESIQTTVDRYGFLAPDMDNEILAALDSSYVSDDGVAASLRT